jgi:hypothetical protein
LSSAPTSSSRRDWFGAAGGTLCADLLEFFQWGQQVFVNGRVIPGRQLESSGQVQWQFEGAPQFGSGTFGLLGGPENAP